MSNKIIQSKDEIEIIYNQKCNKENSLRIFGEIFVKNNIDKCKILYEEK